MHIYVYIFTYICNYIHIHIHIYIYIHIKVCAHKHMDLPVSSMFLPTVMGISGTAVHQPYLYVFICS
jgi:hypothetical protein